MTTPFGGPPAPVAQQPFGGQQQAQQPFGQPAPQQQSQQPAAAPWSSPSETPQGDNIDFSTLTGALLLFKPTAYHQEVSTKFGTKDAVESDVTVIGAAKDVNGNWIGTPPEQSQTFHGVYIFGARLIGMLKGKVGNGMVLGKLISVPTDKGNPAHDLSDPEPQDQAAAMAWYNAQPSAAPPF